ncbi:hypothetical protein GEMRC1_012185 [Eukaryota sp. GEM-RC1]
MLTFTVTSSEEPCSILDAITLVDQKAMVLVFGSSIFVYDLFDGRFRSSLGGSISKIFNYHANFGSVYFSREGVSDSCGNLSEITVSFHDSFNNWIIIGSSCGKLFCFNVNNWMPYFYYSLTNYPINFIEILNLPSAEIGNQIVLIFGTQNSVLFYNITKSDRPVFITQIQAQSPPRQILVISPSYFESYVFFFMDTGVKIFEFINNDTVLSTSFLCRIDNLICKKAFFSDHFKVMILMTDDYQIYLFCPYSFHLICCLKFPDNSAFHLLNRPFDCTFCSIFSRQIESRQIESRDHEVLSSILISIAVDNVLITLDFLSSLPLIANHFSQLKTATSSGSNFTEFHLSYTVSKRPHLVKSTTTGKLPSIVLNELDSIDFDCTITCVRSPSDYLPAFLVGFSDGSVAMIDSSSQTILGELQKKEFFWNFKSLAFKDTSYTDLSILETVTPLTSTINQPTILTFDREFNRILALLTVKRLIQLMDNRSNLPIQANQSHRLMILLLTLIPLAPQSNHVQST